MPDVYYTIEELSKMLKVSEDTIRRAIREGKLEAYKVRGQYRVTAEQLKRYLERKE